MSDGLFWLSDERFARLEQLLPTDTRGKRRVDDRRVISRIIQLPKSGGRWIDAPAAYVPRKTLYNRLVRWAEKGVRTRIFDTLANSGGPALEVMLDSTAVRAHRVAHGGKGGAGAQALGRARGGSGTKIHALSDGQGRPLAFHLTGSNVSDFTASEALLPRVHAGSHLHADKCYDSDRIRRQVEAARAVPNILPGPTRNWKNCLSPYLYRSRNAIERMFGRLKEFRRIATRHDRNGTNFVAAISIAATISYWLGVRSLGSRLILSRLPKVSGVGMLRRQDDRFGDSLLRIDAAFAETNERLACSGRGRHQIKHACGFCPAGSAAAFGNRGPASWPATLITARSFGPRRLRPASGARSRA